MECDVKTVIAIGVFALFFAIFALVGPAERSRGCGGRNVGKKRCGKCPLGTDKPVETVACPGAKALQER